MVPRTQETRNQITRAGRATSHVYPGDKSPIFYKTASAEIAPCDIIIAPLLGRARDSGDAVAGGYHLRVPLRSQNRDFFTPRGEKSVANHTKTPRRWQFFCHLSGTDLATSDGLPTTPIPLTRLHTSRVYLLPRGGGGVRRAAITARASDNKKNNLTSRRRAANTQPYQPLPVVGLTSTSTGTPDMS